MKRISLRGKKRATTRRLVRRALRTWNSHMAWDAISTLHLRGTKEVLALTGYLARSPNWRKRALALDIAAQLRRQTKGISPRSVEYGPETTRELLLAGLRDKHPEVIQSAVSGLGHRPCSDGLLQLIELSKHPSAAIRWTLACTLGSYPEHAATITLIKLAQDQEADIRDWATFSLGTLHTADSDDIRNLLWKNIHDASSDVRGEALCGLAKRGDPRALQYLLAHLNHDCQVYELAAAEELADDRLLPRLLRLAGNYSSATDDTYWSTCLHAAIKACSAN